jgi:hypothetical protein
VIFFEFFRPYGHMYHDMKSHETVVLIVSLPDSQLQTKVLC